MNKLKLLLITILTILFVIQNVYAIPVSDYKNTTTGYEVIIEDDANLLQQEEIAKLKDEMIPLTEYGNIIFKTIDENYTTAEYFSETYYHNKFGTESGTILLIDMDTRYIYIFSDGSNYNVITDSKATIITDNIYQYASDENYYECASKAFSQVMTLLEGGKISEPMKHISNILISITIAFFVSFLIVITKTNIYKPKLKEKINNCNVRFCAYNIVPQKTGTRKEYSPQSSSSGSSGGFSGGGGGGSRSSGGGGGHRF